MLWWPPLWRPIISCLIQCHWNFKWPQNEWLINEDYLYHFLSYYHYNKKSNFILLVTVCVDSKRLVIFLVFNVALNDPCSRTTRCSTTFCTEDLKGGTLYMEISFRIHIRRTSGNRDYGLLLRAGSSASLWYLGWARKDQSFLWILHRNVSLPLFGKQLYADLQR